jgi:hypothetical protein
MYLWAEIRHIDRKINFVSGSPMTALGQSRRSDRASVTSGFS